MAHVGAWGSLWLELIQELLWHGALELTIDTGGLPIDYGGSPYNHGGSHLSLLGWVRDQGGWPGAMVGYFLALRAHPRPIILTLNNLPILESWMFTMESWSLGPELWRLSLELCMLQGCLGVTSWSQECFSGLVEAHLEPWMVTCSFGGLPGALEAYCRAMEAHSWSADTLVPSSLILL